VEVAAQVLRLQQLLNLGRVVQVVQELPQAYPAVLLLTEAVAAAAVTLVCPITKAARAVLVAAVTVALMRQQPTATGLLGRPILVAVAVAQAMETLRVVRALAPLAALASSSSSTKSLHPPLSSPSSPRRSGLHQRVR
jgi:hypothetical protein